MYDIETLKDYFEYPYYINIETILNHKIKPNKNYDHKAGFYMIKKVDFSLKQ